VKKIFPFLLIFITCSTLAVDAEIIKANNHTFSISSRVNTISDKQNPQIIRQMEFSNFANEFAQPGANWQLIKESVLDIIIADPGFWGEQMVQFPAVQEKLLNDFSMDWYNEGTSNYPEKLNLAKVQLQRELEQIRSQKKLLDDLLSKLNSIKPTSLD